MEQLPTLRCGIVGFGAMGRRHAEVIRDHPYFSLKAISSQSTQPDVAAEFGCRWFESADELLASGLVDVLIVATPHWSHSAIAASGLRAGLHVICEKPLTVSSQQADELMSVARDSKGILTCVFQTRFEPVLQRVRALLVSGELGPITRCEMEESFWRTNAYYRSQEWRATWKGEGGGVLINQAPHVLDRYLWLCGMPENVVAFCDTTLHPIEVEDVATAIFRHKGGWHGHVHINTTECPQTSRLRICCDRGRITVENGMMRIERLAASIRERTGAADGLFENIEAKAEEADGSFIESPAVLLSRFYENFALAVAGRQPLAISAREAAEAVELTNAIQLAGANRAAVSLPIQRAEFEAFMAARLSHS